MALYCSSSPNTSSAAALASNLSAFRCCWLAISCCLPAFSCCLAPIRALRTIQSESRIASVSKRVALREDKYGFAVGWRGAHFGKIAAVPARSDILHNYVHALGMAARYEEARAAERKLAEMANALRDDVSTVYAFIARSLIDSILAPRDAEDYNAEVLTMAMAREANDKYLSIWLHWVIGWNAFHRGLILKCYSYAHKLMAIGRRVNDPRALGHGLWLMGYAAVVLEDYRSMRQNLVCRGSSRAPNWACCRDGGVGPRGWWSGRRCCLP
jgi:hypothetical protein